jgi:lipopolysaccharide assembly protein A
VRFVYWLSALLLAIVLADFAVSNLAEVAVGFWPLPAVLAPIYGVVLGALLLGFLAGEFVAWFNGRTWRREARRRARRIEALERELAATQLPKSPATRLPVPAAHD